GALDAAAFDESIESVGVSLSTTVDHYYSGVSAEFLSGDFAPGLGLLADLVQRPSFQPEEFERARAKALAELVQSLEDPSTVADRRFARFLFGSHPYGRPDRGYTDVADGADARGCRLVPCQAFRPLQRGPG